VKQSETSSASEEGKHSVSMRAVKKANCLAFLGSEPEALCQRHSPKATSKSFVLRTKVLAELSLRLDAFEVCH